MYNTNIDYNLLYNYYITENHTRKETADYFHVTDASMKNTLHNYQIRKSRQQLREVRKRCSKEKYGVPSPACNPKVIAKMRATKLQRYGHSGYNNIEKIRQTCREKYGVDNPSQIFWVAKKKTQKYNYNNESFDSSWELALWIYCEDHHEHIVHWPCQFEFWYEGVRHIYTPDFEYEGQIIDIKSDFFIKNDKLICPFNHQRDNLYEAKHQCMKEHNVIIWTQKDIQKYLDYISSKYGKNYLIQFKKS